MRDLLLIRNTESTVGYRWTSIQSLRGVACLLVSVMHLLGFATRGGSSEIKELHKTTQLVGYVGVDIFFVISGFVVWILLAKNPGVLSFAIKRVTRIYPAFWFALVLILVMEKVRGLNFAFNDIVARPEGFFLLDVCKALPVSWTMLFELNFYFVVALTLILSPFRYWFLVGWMLIQVGFIVAKDYGFAPIGSKFIHPLSIEFMLGIGVGWAINRFKLKYSWFWVILIFIVWVTVGSLWGFRTIGPNGYYRVLVWGVPSAILVWALISVELKGWASPSWLNKIGDWSYSIYLLHWPVAIATQASLGKVPSGVWGGLFYFAICLLVTLSLSWISFSFVEKPFVRIGQKLGLRADSIELKAISFVREKIPFLNS